MLHQFRPRVRSPEFFAYRRRGFRFVPLVPDYGVGTYLQGFGQFLQLEPAAEAKILKRAAEGDRRDQEVVRISVGLRERLFEGVGQERQNPPKDPRIGFAGLVALESRDNVVAHPALSTQFFDREADSSSHEAETLA